MNEFKIIVFITLIIFITAKIIALILRKDYGKIIKKDAKLPSNKYKLIYTDEKVSERKEHIIYSKLLKSEKYGIQGKPDYIYQKSDDLMPVELKSGRIGENEMPYQGDLMQLVAYFIIIEENFSVQPKYGRLIYKDYMFIVKNTKAIRNDLISITKDMKAMLKDKEADPGAEYTKCRHCICRGTVCEFCDF